MVRSRVDGMPLLARYLCTALDTHVILSIFGLKYVSQDAGSNRLRWPTVPLYVTNLLEIPRDARRVFDSERLVTACTISKFSVRSICLKVRMAEKSIRVWKIMGVKGILRFLKI